MPSAIDHALGRSRAKATAPATVQAAFDLGMTDSTVSLTDASPQVLADSLELWTRAGYAVTLSRTSDGGAISFALLAGDWRKKLYAASADELAVILARVAEAAAPQRGGDAT